MTNATLPDGFADLEPFAGYWALEGSAARANRRGESTPEARAAFYGVMKDRLRAVLDHLDDRDVHALGAEDQRLMNLALAFAHVSLAVEMQGAAEPVHAAARVFMPVTRAPAGA